MIEDTTFIIDLLGGDADALELLETIEQDRRPEKVASITVLELYEGVAQSSKPAKERELVLEVLDSKHVVPGDHDLMAAAGEISGELAAEGRRIDREDCVIAATARQEDEPVVTRNVDHFERIPDVDVVSY